VSSGSRQGRIRVGPWDGVKACKPLSNICKKVSILLLKQLGPPAAITGMRMFRNLLLLGVGLLAAEKLSAAEAPRVPILPSIPDKVFKAADHGAVADGTTDNTKAIQDTIDATVAAGGGVVEIPPGELLCGPLKLSSHLNIHLSDRTVLKLLPIDKYPGGTNNPGDFLSATNLEDIAVTGKGTIDGQGAEWWPLAKKKPADDGKIDKRPRMISMRSCQRILIQDVKLMNSPMFHIAIGGKTSDVTVRGVTVRAPSSTDPKTPSHNTDACDVTGQHILIENCDISVGDDNYTCGGGTSDVTIRHCTYGNGHGVSIGSGTAGGVSNITVEDCTFTNTECGIRVKSDRGRGGLVEHLTYRNLKMTNVNIPILIYSSYMATDKQFRDLNNLTAEVAAKYPAQPVANLTPIYKDITFTNITATVAKGRRAGLIWGLPEAPAQNIVLQKVNITADKPFGVYNVQGFKLENCNIVTPDGVNKLSISTAPTPSEAEKN